MKSKISLLMLIFALIFSAGFSQQLPKKKGMIGIQIYQLDSKFFVGKVFKNSPADRAGFADGDEILNVAGKTVNGLSIQEVLDLFDGDPGEFVAVGISRKGEQTSLSVPRVSPDNLVEDSADFKSTLTESIPDDGSIHPNPDTNIIPGNEAEKKWRAFFLENYGIDGFLIDADFSQKTGAIFSEGFLICSIDSKSPAAAELKKWELIVKIDGLKIGQAVNSMDYGKLPGAVLRPIQVVVMSVTGEKPVTIAPLPSKESVPPKETK